MKTTKQMQEKLNVLNGLDVIESQGGEEAYALVLIDENMLENLNDVGIDSKTVYAYGDEETTCIASIAFGEGLANWWDGDKFYSVEKGDVYHHYKGDFYEIVGLSEHTETGEGLVLYKNKNPKKDDTIWSRPIKMFFEYLPENKYIKRFTLQKTKGDAE